MNVLIYLRVSGKSQIDKDGPDRQRDSIKIFCAGHNLTILGEKFEAGVSGTIDAMDRPAFVELLTEIECRRANGQEIAGIVVERADRLARDLMVSEILLSECRKRGIKVFVADRSELIDLASDQSDPTQVLIRQLLSALAQWEKSTLCLKLKKARERVKAKTGWCGGHHPFGTRKEDKIALQLLQSDIVSSGLTLERQARLLTEAGLRQKNGKPYNRQGVHHIRKLIAAGKVVV